MRRSAAAVALAMAVIVLAPAATADAVVGGHEATRPYPFIASLQIDGTQLCGGSLVAPRWVLTAGHCADVAGQLPGRLTVRIGSLDRTRGGSLTGVAEMIVHSGFAYGGSGPATVLNDIALIRLDRAVPQQPVGIGTLGGGPTRILGWGCTHDHTPAEPCDPTAYPVRLRELDTRVVPDSRCTDLTPGLDLCTAAVVDHAQTCAGDSGGPLIRRVPGSSSGRWELVGVASRPGRQTTTPCPGTVVTYTNATAYRTWVLTTTRR